MPSLSYVLICTSGTRHSAKKMEGLNFHLSKCNQKDLSTIFSSALTADDSSGETERKEDVKDLSFWKLFHLVMDN